MPLSRLQKCVPRGAANERDPTCMNKSKKTKTRKKKINVAVVGLNMGAYHLECFAKNPLARVVAVCGLNAAFAAETAKKFGVPFSTADYRDLLRMKDLDAVSIAVPTGIHAPVAIDFLNAGKHVLVEKPMSHTRASALEMAAAARRNGVVLTVHHNRRYEPGAQYVKRLVDSGALGEIYFVRTGWRRNGNARISPTYETGGHTFNRNWFTMKDQGGGVLLDLGTHMLDRALYLLGFPAVSRVMCHTHRELGKIEEATEGYEYSAEDLAAAMIQFDTGTTLQLEVSFGSYIEENAVYLELYGSKGGVSFRQTEAAGAVVKVIEPKLGALAVSRISNLPDPGIATPVDDFLGALAEGRPPAITLDQCLKVMDLLERLKESAQAATRPQP